VEEVENMKRSLVAGLAIAIAVMFAPVASAGPVIIDGSDANDFGHGSTNGVSNFGGFLYMQNALENIAGQLSAGVTKVVVSLGTTSGSQARSAIDSAFSLSALPGSSWTILHVDGTAAVASHLASLNTANTGILYIPTVSNTSGDMSTAELAAVNAAAASINTFVGGAGVPTTGGGLFSMGENPSSFSGVAPYGWLTTLIPGITIVPTGSGSPITLTAAGATAFPSLTNAQLAGATPWHNNFTGSFGGLSVLGVSLQSGISRNVILGGGAGTVIGCGAEGQPDCPTTNGGAVIPEPSSLMLLGLGGFGAGVIRRRRQGKI